MTFPPRVALPRPSASWWSDDPRRDLRIDFLRGLFVALMIVDHTWHGTPLNRITGNGHRVFTAAEGFILLSGVTVGFVYPRVVARRGLGGAALRLVRRAAIIYAVAVAAGLVSTIIILRRTSRLDELPGHLVEIVSFRHPYGASVLGLESILLLYSVLFLIGPVTIALLHWRKTPVLIALAASAWAAQEYLSFGYTGSGIDRLEIGGLNTRFALLQVWAVWAVLAAIMWHRRRLVPIAGRLPLWAWFSLGTGVVVACATRFSDRNVSRVLFQPPKLLICAATIVMLFSGMMLFSRFLIPALGWLLIPLGQQALLAVAAHIVLLSLAASPFGAFGRLQGTGQQLLMLACVWLIAQLWVGTIRASRDAIPAQPPPVAGLGEAG